jgi:[acyl-carrier-protein] S-malonyltransferase
MTPNASSKVAFLFPGQASQSVGMGMDLVESFEEAAEVFRLADEVLGSELTRLCFEGPLEVLTETRNAQPAILTHSLAVAAILASRAEAGLSYVAGHSLGEFSAAAAVGALSAANSLRVVRRRGELMWEAGQRVAGTMAAVVGLDEATIEAVCAEVSGPGVGTVVVANLNAPTQIVISGDVGAVEAAAEPLKAAGARRVLPLKVSGAFHSPLMESVQGEFGSFLSGIEFEDASCPVVNNVAAEPVTDGAALRDGFVRQLVSPVRWHQSVQAMVEAGVELFVEVGPGNVLTNLGSRAFRDATFLATSDVAGVEKVLATLTSDR